MKKTKIWAVVPLIALTVAVASCGGGGDDEAGSPTVLSVQPTTSTLTAVDPANGGPPAGTCSAGFAGEFFVYGGAAPYRIDNTLPDYMILNKTTVGERGGSFTVTFTGGCLAPGLIVIVDKLDKQVILTLNNKPSAAAPPASAASS